MRDPVATERAVLAEIALLDCWVSARPIVERLSLRHADAHRALRALIKAGVVGFDHGLYGLLRRPVRFWQRAEVVS